MTLKEMPSTVVHCKTKAEYDRLMQIYEEAGWMWRGGEKPTCYENFQNSPCIRVCDRFSGATKAWYELEGCRILSLDQFLQEQNIGLKPEDLKVGDWVEVMEEFEDIWNGYFVFRVGEKYKVTDTERTEWHNCWTALSLEAKGFKNFAINEKYVSKLRKCSPPEEKSPQRIEAEERERLFYGMGDTELRARMFGLSRAIVNARLQEECTKAKLGYYSSTPSFMDCCKSVVQKARDLALSPMERKYRKLGLKDSEGLTEAGREVFLDVLFEEFGSKLMDARVKKLSKDEDDE